MLKNESFWCNRSDSCDNDSIPADHACQSKKTFNGYCENSIECQSGFVCDLTTNQCSCPDSDSNYFSGSSCVPKKSVNTYCFSDIECLSSQLLTCQDQVCLCPNATTYYFSSTNNTCQLKNTYQVSCPSNDGCRSDLGLDCNSVTNVCDCRDNGDGNGRG